MIPENKIICYPHRHSTTIYENYILFLVSYESIKFANEQMPRTEKWIRGTVSYNNICMFANRLERWIIRISCAPSQVMWNVTVNLVDCPKNRSEIITFKIYPWGLTDALTIELHPICSCDCEGLNKQTINATACNGHGGLQCGICSCNHGFDGNNCECRIGENYTPENKYGGCIQ